MKFQGKRIIVTAAASGMGRAGCEQFAREGGAVVAVDIDRDRLQSVVDGINGSGGKALAIVADLLEADSCQRIIHEGAEWLGGLDVLWNHAGIPAAPGIEDLDLAEYAKAMDLNVRSGALATAAAIPHMRKAGAGAIVFTASVAGLVGFRVSPIYSAAKFGVVGLAKALALRYAPERIRVNVVCPGATDTPMLPQFFGPNQDPKTAAEAQARAKSLIPLGRYGQPEEIARAAVWLASDEASFITGVALPVDGGFTAA
ncbi:glucose 1-dehydrogenase [Variovorax paradoxus]|nr:glucose 1-dehydrogenase [Variovorax paradoxus]MBT2304839.1 glucose 1-dehydrogenase [Variovorax paradoxus]